MIASKYIFILSLLVSTNTIIPDKETAISVAEIVLVKIYGKEVLSQRPFLVTLKDNIWIIEGQLEKDMDGGVAYIEIDKQTGQIRKVIHTK